MKILRVRLTSLNSLRGQHEVDFEKDPLAGAGLFAITGPTGAGKSTLLDAITLALYGKAARYGSTPSPEDMMSRHCGECAAEVEFRVPSGTYRAEWQLRRARSKASGAIQPPKRYVYDSANQPLAQNIRDTEELIEKLVGLDYQRFLRSALLAQGEFAQFLKARPDDRAALLESLTGTSIYSELGALAHTETVRRENDLAATEAGLQQIQLLSEEQRQKLAADIPAAAARFSEVKRELQQANELLNKATNLTGALEQEKKALENQRTLAKERDAAEPILQRLSRHRLTLPFHGDIGRLEAVEKTATTARTVLDQASREHSRVLLKARLCLRGYRRVLDDQVKASRIDIGRCGEKIRIAGERKATAEAWFKEHKSDEDLAEGLADLVSDLAGLKNTRKDLEREWATLRKLVTTIDRKEAEELPQSAEEITKARLRRIPARFSELLKKKQAEASAAKKQAEQELQLREDHLAKARLIASFEDHRSSLKTGEPCPLCGALDHPFAEGAEPSFPFKDLERRVMEAKEACRKREKECDDLEQLLANLKENGVSLQAAVGDRSGIVDRLAKTLSQFAMAVPPAGKEDETKSNLQQRAAAYRKQANEAEAAERDRAEATADQKRLEAGLTNFSDKQSALASESLPGLPEGEGTAAEATEALPCWPSVGAAAKDWADARNDLTAKGATLENRGKDQARAQTELSELLSGMSARLAGSVFAGIDDLKAARLAPVDATRTETLENTLTRSANQLDADLRAARASIEKWRMEAAPEGEAVEKLRARQQELQSQHDQLIRDLTIWKKELAQDDTNHQTVADKRKELEADRQKLEIWRRLRGLIGSYDGRTFRRFAQGISLDVLVHYANRHLLRLSDRYRLRRRVGEELELEIEDLHQAGAVRPMASLSGGESFLVSLALALGLSDIAGRNVRIESLFIDEGFGSLDSDTLDLAISALETLRQDNKTVGVISHVDLLKERIATQIIVEKQSGGTSVLRLAS